MTDQATQSYRVLVTRTERLCVYVNAAGTRGELC